MKGLDSIAILCGIVNIMAMIKYGVKKEELPTKVCPKCGKIIKLYIDSGDLKYCKCERKEKDE